MKLTRHKWGCNEGFNGGGAWATVDQRFILFRPNAVDPSGTDNARWAIMPRSPADEALLLACGLTGRVSNELDAHFPTRKAALQALELALAASEESPE